MSLAVSRDTSALRGHVTLCLAPLIEEPRGRNGYGRRLLREQAEVRFRLVGRYPGCTGTIELCHGLFCCGVKSLSGQVSIAWCLVSCDLLSESPPPFAPLTPPVNLRAALGAVRREAGGVRCACVANGALRGAGRTTRSAHTRQPTVLDIGHRIGGVIQEQAGLCQTRGWTGRTRTAAMSAHDKGFSIVTW